jgi:hypothetical protein
MYGLFNTDRLCGLVVRVPGYIFRGLVFVIDTEIAFNGVLTEF